MCLLSGTSSTSSIPQPLLPRACHWCVTRQTEPRTCSRGGSTASCCRQVNERRRCSLAIAPIRPLARAVAAAALSAWGPPLLHNSVFECEHPHSLSVCVLYTVYMCFRTVALTTNTASWKASQYPHHQWKRMPSGCTREFPSWRPSLTPCWGAAEPAAAAAASLSRREMGHARACWGRT